MLFEHCCGKKRWLCYSILSRVKKLQQFTSLLTNVLWTWLFVIFVSYIWNILLYVNFKKYLAYWTASGLAIEKPKMQVCNCLVWLIVIIISLIYSWIQQLVWSSQAIFWTQGWPGLLFCFIWRHEKGKLYAAFVYYTSISCFCFLFSVLFLCYFCLPLKRKSCFFVFVVCFLLRFIFFTITTLVSYWFYRNSAMISRTIFLSIKIFFMHDKFLFPFLQFKGPFFS